MSKLDRTKERYINSLSYKDIPNKLEKDPLKPWLYDISIIKKYAAKVESSKARNITFELTLTDYKKLLNKRKCFYTGVSIAVLKTNHKHPQQLTLDRINPDKGYTVENTVACSSSINTAKSYFEKPNSITCLQDLIKIGKVLEKTLK